MKHNLHISVSDKPQRNGMVSCKSISLRERFLRMLFGRKQKKRQMRQLWIARINAAARMNGLSYSKFMFGIKTAGIEMNRKMLAELAVNDAAAFTKLADAAKANLK